jgi:hypothetical protein
MSSNSLKIIIPAIVIIALTAFFLWPRTGTEIPPTPNGPINSRFEEYRNNIVSGGVPKDGIPSIDNPKYVSVEEAESFLDTDDRVFILENEEEVWVFPQIILVWHEIVNEMIGEERISITYCPLTGSVVGYKGFVSRGTSTFGTSGKLINSNLVMYDRASESYWPQILGQAVAGPLTGEYLEDFPVLWSKWQNVKDKYTDAKVLTTNTGFIRTYGTDPYGSYQNTNNYYDSGEPFFPTMHDDDRLASKTVVIGIHSKNSAVAILKSTAEQQNVINLELNNQALTVFYDEELETVRVFNRDLGGTIYDFTYSDGFSDLQTGSEWSVNGKAINGDLLGEKLEIVTSFDVMWFAWVAFYPNTELIL